MLDCLFVFAQRTSKPIVSTILAAPNDKKQKNPQKNVTLEKCRHEKKTFKSLKYYKNSGCEGLKKKKDIPNYFPLLPGTFYKIAN